MKWESNPIFSQVVSFIAKSVFQLVALEMCPIGHRNYGRRVSVISDQPDLWVCLIACSPWQTRLKRGPVLKGGSHWINFKVLCGPGVWLSGGACACAWKVLEGSIPSHAHAHIYTHTLTLTWTHVHSKRGHSSVCHRDRNCQVTAQSSQEHSG